MKHRITDTTRLEESSDTRVILRRTSTGLLTVEMDVGTLKELGLPVCISGSRWCGDLELAIENGPAWNQQGRKENLYF